MLGGTHFKCTLIFSDQNISHVNTIKIGNSKVILNFFLHIFTFQLSHWWDKIDHFLCILIYSCSFWNFIHMGKCIFCLDSFVYNFFSTTFLSLLQIKSMRLFLNVKCLLCNLTFFPPLDN